MKIVCNGEERTVPAGILLVDLLLQLGLDPDTVVVECDSVILKRPQYDSHILTEGSVLELIRFVGGG
ncbi:MAG: sulfur carrier protein ThiS [Desulfobulbaceae bacterium]|nr:sulfur carrier protein ThiS [Desulfobulbaceae bacterium]